jgi:hypothetical protein
MISTFCNIIIGEDSIPFTAIEYEEVPVERKDFALKRVHDTLQGSPVIVDISNLDYVPDQDSVWDGSNFSGHESATKLQSEQALSSKRVAFLIDNKYQFFYALNQDSEKGRMLYAALLSNPSFIFVNK